MLNLKWILLSGLTIWSLAAPANIFYRDQRTQVRPVAGDSLATIGTLTKPATGTHGTAFLVGRCLILTNYHVAFSDQLHPDFSERTLFRAGGEESWATPVVAGNYAHAPAANDADWALLKLDRCLGETLGFLNLRNEDLFSASRETVKMAGYPFDKNSDALTLSPACHIDGQTLPDRGGWRHDCASRAGNSGGPLYVETPQGPQVLALNSSEAGSFDEIISSYDIHFGNGAVPVSVFFRQIQEFLKADRSAAQGPLSQF